MFRFLEIIQSIRREAIIDGVKIFFVDHIGIIQGQENRQSRNDWLGFVTSQLKIMCKELNVSIV